MCGIAGFVDLTGNREYESNTKCITKMLQCLHHRGPDQTSCWNDVEKAVFLGHKRLSIIDLSENGTQPMVSFDNSMVIVFNGEIYNYNEVKIDLGSSGYVFNSKTDTEVLLYAIHKWGVESALKRVRGMFAFAVFDKNKETLTISRDRTGEKPLYYHYNHKHLTFSSELKSLIQNPQLPRKICSNSLSLYFRHGYIPEPYSIYENVFKLKPGSYKVFKILNNSLVAEDETAYWRLPELNNNSLSYSQENAEIYVSDAETILKKAVKEQMVADVPVGAFLSGGIDSSTIVALMREFTTKPIKTFTIGFNERRYNEAEHAKKVAKHLETDHHELYVSADEALSIVPKLSEIYSEPFADTSQIPTLLLAKLTKSLVTVSLSGDGGDELFGGYTRYSTASGINKKVKYIPFPIRHAFGGIIRNFPEVIWKILDKTAGIKAGKDQVFRKISPRIKRLGNWVESANRGELYYSMIANKDGFKCTKGNDEPFFSLLNNLWGPDSGSFLRKMMEFDFLTYLPGDILVKVDRACMNYSLEGRIPLLDQRLIEYSRTIPDEILKFDGKPKYILREILKRHVPTSITDRPKMGFGIPVNEWISSELKDWISYLFYDLDSEAYSLIDISRLRKNFENHCSGLDECGPLIWYSAMYLDWYTKVHLSPVS